MGVVVVVIVVVGWGDLCVALTWVFSGDGRVAVGGGGGGNVGVVVVVSKVASSLLDFESVVSCRFATVGSLNPPPTPPPEKISLRNPQTLFSFEADATALVPDVFSLGFEDEYEELEADLQEFSEKFADSPAAQVRFFVWCGLVLFVSVFFCCCPRSRTCFCFALFRRGKGGLLTVVSVGLCAKNRFARDCRLLGSLLGEWSLGCTV